MNVYDFDGTIYAGDSSVDFFRYALRKKPSLLRYVPKQLMGFCLYGMGRIDKTRLKEYYFSFLSGVDADALAEDFWACSEGRIYDWYRKQQAEDDIIISASPAFLLRPICRRLHIRRLIASVVDPKTGRFTGENCKGEEKVKRLREEGDVTHIDSFYSDSQSDLPLARLAEQAFLVEKGEIRRWHLE